MQRFSRVDGESGRKPIILSKRSERLLAILRLLTYNLNNNLPIPFQIIKIHKYNLLPCSQSKRACPLPQELPGKINYLTLSPYFCRIPLTVNLAELNAPIIFPFSAAKSPTAKRPFMFVSPSCDTAALLPFTSTPID